MPGLDDSPSTLSFGCVNPRIVWADPIPKVVPVQGGSDAPFEPLLGFGSLGQHKRPHNYKKSPVSPGSFLVGASGLEPPTPTVSR